MNKGATGNGTASVTPVMKRAMVWLCVAVALLLGAVGVARTANSMAFESYGRAHLQRLYVAAQQLQAGMEYEQALSVVSKAEGSGLWVASDRPGQVLALHATVGLADVCSVYVYFHRNRISSTSIIGEDGPHDRCPDAPANIEPE